ncbi:DUF916 domain-containing protein [bacterium]|nr:DUF916 domain-containing protein [bacterium]
MQKRKKGIFLLSLLVCFIIFFGFFGSNIQVKAAEDQEVAIYPAHWDPNKPLTQSWFIYSLDPGETKTDEVQLFNLSDKPIDILLYPVDALTTKEGAFALKNKTEKQTDIGSWIKLAYSEITLGPKEVRNIPFVISVPKDAEVGDHAGGIIMEKKIPKKYDIGKQIGVNVVTRVGVRVYTTVKGEIHRLLQINKFFQKTKNKKRYFVLELKNNGNVRLSPEGVIVIKNLFQRISARLPIEKRGEIFPKKIITKEIFWANPPLIGRFVAQAILNYDGQQAKSLPLVIWIVPWWAILILVLIILLIIISIIRRIKRKKNRSYQVELTRPRL